MKERHLQNPLYGGQSPQQNPVSQPAYESIELPAADTDNDEMTYSDQGGAAYSVVGTRSAVETGLDQQEYNVLVHSNDQHPTNPPQGDYSKLEQSTR